MLNKLHITAGCLLIIALVMGNCTIDNTTNASSNAVTEQDLQAATQILGESISGANSGVVLSVSDALTILAQTNFNAQISAHSKGPYPRVQDEKINYSRRYNPDTGTHTVSFRREAANPFFQKSVTDTLTYIYRDDTSNFVEFPVERRERIASVNYTGWWQGTVSTLQKESFFTRRDTFLVAGLSGSATNLTLEGVHYGSGTVTLNPPEQPSFKRSYNLTITFLDIDLGQSALSNPLQGAIKSTGTLSWQIQYTGGPGQGTTLRGTIELHGDGTGLLRFQSSPALYVVNLSSGEVKNLDNAFEGCISTLDISGHEFVLLSGLKVTLSEDTQITGMEEYASLEGVQAALASGIRVWAEGAGSLQGNQFNSTQVAFKAENGEVNNQEGIAFEEIVTSVTPEAQTFTVGSRVTIQISDRTTISEQGDYQSLQQVMEGLNENRTITAAGSVIASPADGVNAITVIFNNNDEN